MSLSEFEPPMVLVPQHEPAENCPHRARVIRQLLEAALFEGVLAYEYDDEWFSFSTRLQSYFARGSVSSFGRVRLIQEDIWQRQGEQIQAVDLALLVKGLPGRFDSTNRLLHELEQTIAFSRWNEAHLNTFGARRGLDYIALESAIHEGHTYHPCFKARTGFSEQDHADYGPEAGNRFQLCWLAVKRQYLMLALDCDSERDFWLRELGEGTWQQLLTAMADAGIDFVDYGLLPVHPWQVEHLRDTLASPVAQKYLINLGKVGDYYQASISLRTLLNVSHPEKANIKLPLNVVNSSSLRIIEPHSVCTAPVLSYWLKHLISQDPWFQRHASLHIQSEYAGVVLCNQYEAALDSSDETAWVDLLAPSLSVIFRDSAPVTQQSTLQALPFVALSLIEPDGEGFIAPWLRQYGVAAWVKQLITVVVLPVWHLLVRHGIALETHAQNLTLLHDNGWPKELVVRDFHESLEFVEGFLSAPEEQPDFKALHPAYQHARPNRFYWMSSIEALRELLVDTLFVYNLSELSWLLEQQFAYPESEFWQQADDALQAYAATVPECSARLAQLDLHQAQIQTESLLRKKLSGQSDTEFHHTISNPLHQCREGAQHVVY